MTRIKDLADAIKDELHSAKEYAEEYLTLKAQDNGNWANRYKEMAQEELKHAGHLQQCRRGRNQRQRKSPQGESAERVSAVLHRALARDPERIYADSNEIQGHYLRPGYRPDARDHLQLYSLGAR